ncbi:efflux RND transporter periplasmic adaptor subunit [Azorhizobium doebereinerae]|uniref:efflux RND transporter periplasmic adaptor subunit n=1 Tax=Azorhizobium doebereinerae TaxID=281091 RepID=UPI00068473BD|nr:HlyD family secretion protein [Azorhizobium doebereinerae]
MKSYLATAGRIGVTLCALVLAVLVGGHLWRYYMEEPWTRDGRVRAAVVEVAPDVSGLVSEVDLPDNATVHKGDLLFRIDPRRFEIALAQAEASLASKQAALDQAVRESKRYSQLNDSAVTQQKREQVETELAQDRAALASAQSDRDLAALNLERSSVRAPVDGKITNFDLRPGNYVTAGKAVAALVDAHSFYVAGYFEETKLPRIHVGDPVLIHLMGGTVPLHGHVESIAAGIEDRERSDGTSLLANVTPTFSWVRLAQRVPVRIAIDPATANLVAGRTATVEVLPGAGQPVAAGEATPAPQP